MKYITKKARLSETERNQNSKQSEDAHSAWGFVQHRGNDIHAIAYGVKDKMSVTS